VKSRISASSLYAESGHAWVCGHEGRLQGTGVRVGRVGFSVHALSERVSLVT